MNRGSVEARYERPDTERRFNEAPIHESGKCLGCSAGRPIRSGFNEAPIHESGK